MKQFDPRWSFTWIIPSLTIQLLLSAITLGFAASSIDDIEVLASTIPLSIATLTIISVVVQLICYFTKTLHPLVVLTIAIELMVVWLAGIITVATYTLGSENRCSNDSEYYTSRLRASRKAQCSRGIGIVVVVVLTFVSYLWLVTYSAIVRKRTRMPYAPIEQSPSMGQQQQGSSAVPGNTSTNAGQDIALQDRAVTSTEQQWDKGIAQAV